MFKKLILFVLICILTVQIYPVQWLFMLVDEVYAIELIVMNEFEEDADDEISKDKNVKIFEYDIVLLNTNEALTRLLNCTHTTNSFSSNHCSEVLCPPTNFI